MQIRELGRGARWSIVIVVGVVLYMGSTTLANALGWAEGMGRSLGVGVLTGVIVGAVAAWLGILGDGGDGGHGGDGTGR